MTKYIYHIIALKGNFSMKSLKSTLRMFTNRTRIGTYIWAVMLKIRRFLFYRSKRLRKDITVVELINTLNEKNCRYVILRWFDNIPNIKDGDDIDILIHDNDIKIISPLLTRSNRKGSSIFVDVYSVTGLRGFDYKKTSYYPPSIAENLLKRSVVNHMGVRVPSKEDYFYSLAFHAIYHKGSISGLPLSSIDTSRYGTCQRDFTIILSSMAEELGLDTAINVADLSQLLKKKGWQPTQQMLNRFTM